MILATSLPVPEYKAQIKLTPVVKEDMKIHNRYQKENLFFSRGMCQVFLAAWVVILISYSISHIW